MMARPVRRKNPSISGLRAGGEVEGDEEALLPPLALHGRLEGVDVRTAGLVLLLHLHGIPIVHGVEITGLPAGPLALVSDGVDAAVDALAPVFVLFGMPPSAITAR